MKTDKLLSFDMKYQQVPHFGLDMVPFPKAVLLEAIATFLTAK